MRQKSRLQSSSKTPDAQGAGQGATKELPSFKEQVKGGGLGAGQDIQAAKELLTFEEQAKGATRGAGQETQAAMDPPTFQEQVKGGGPEEEEPRIYDCWVRVQVVGLESMYRGAPHVWSFLYI